MGYRLTRKETKQDRAYQKVKAMLLSGDYPVGTRIAEVAAGDLGVSRTTVRECL